MHTAAHTDPLYRSFAEMARKEAGPKVYAYCSGCHSAVGVVSGLIPDTHEEQLPDDAKVGVSCDVCHSISSLTGHDGPWKEPGNASFLLEQGRTKYSSLGEVTANRRHTGDRRDFFAKSEFCASCHTVIHPVNGIRVEHTYAEWKDSVYAQKGIQCQDCHMNSVANAVKVAETLKPIIVEGRSANEGPLRKIQPHFFVGGNSNAERLAGGKQHAAMAVERLKAAARLELVVPKSAHSGKPMSFEVHVHNIGAGHNIPSGITELREMWVDLRIVDQSGKVLFHSGQLDADGRLPENAIRFGAIATDAKGNRTYKLWEVTQLAWKRTIPPKTFSRDTVTATLPDRVSGKLTIDARLLYRSASPDVVKQFMGDKAFEPQVVEMTRAAAEVAVE